jgi:DNA-binding response OmpR family regulator
VLAAKAGLPLTRDEILDHRWSVGHIAGSNVVDRHERTLRARRRKDWRRPRCILTVPGRGSRFLPVTAGGEPPPQPRERQDPRA